VYARKNDDLSSISTKSCLKHLKGIGFKEMMILPIDDECLGYGHFSLEPDIVLKLNYESLSIPSFSILDLRVEAGT
jgi:hypothetical protein